MEAKEKKPNLFQRIKASKNKSKYGKRMFYAWIAYQTIKGTLTTSLIWIPLIYHYYHGK